MLSNNPRYYLLGLLVFASLFCFGQTDNVGSGRSISFDGINDYIDLGNIYDDLALPVTISAWVYIDTDPSYRYPIFNSQDNLPLYNGITFAISSTRIGIQYGDGRGEGQGTFYRGKSGECPDIKGRWAHVCGVMKSASEMELYLNGVNIGGDYGGSSDQPMSSNSPGDVAKIGYWRSNGATYLFKGKIDDLRIWKKALSEAEIREMMCQKNPGNAASLIGHWNFNEISGNVIGDNSANGFNGLAIGSLVHQYSGAPIGDESNYQYVNSWNGKVLSSTDGNATVKNVLNSPEGIQIYKINEVPSQTAGMPASEKLKPYYGVFAAALNAGKKFDIVLPSSCEVFQRPDNSVATWDDGTNPFVGVVDHSEIVRKVLADDFAIDFGPDLTLCNTGSHQLSIDVDELNKTILWSTGEITESIIVNQSGIFSVVVSGDCSVSKDTIAIQFHSTPLPFTFGDDVSTCRLEPKLLRPYASNSDVDYIWQDGSQAPEYQIKDYGTYWVNVKNACGEAFDTITVSRLSLGSYLPPNVITPNGDDFNENFELSPLLQGSQITIFNRWGASIYHSLDYDNTWNGENLSSGIYFYLIRSECYEQSKGTVSLIK